MVYKNMKLFNTSKYLCIPINRKILFCPGFALYIA